MNKTLALFAAGFLLTGMVAGATSNANQAANAGTTPGSVLYPLDQFGEDLQLALASAPVIGGPAKKAKVKANIAEERLAEARELVEEDRGEEAEDLVEDYQDQIEEAASLAEETGDEELEREFVQLAEENEDVLNTIRTSAPSSVAASIDEAIDATLEVERDVDDSDRDVDVDRDDSDTDMDVNDDNDVNDNVNVNDGDDSDDNVNNNTNINDNDDSNVNDNSNVDDNDNVNNNTNVNDDSNVNDNTNSNTDDDDSNNTNTNTNDDSNTNTNSNTDSGSGTSDDSSNSGSSTDSSSGSSSSSSYSVTNADHIFGDNGGETVVIAEVTADSDSDSFDGIKITVEGGELPESRSDYEMYHKPKDSNAYGSTGTAQTSTSNNAQTVKILPSTDNVALETGDKIKVYIDGRQYGDSETVKTTINPQSDPAHTYSTG